MRKHHTLCLIMFLIIGCKSNVHQEKKQLDAYSYILKTYKDTTLIAEQPYSDRAGTEGFYKDYYDDGKIRIYHRYLIGTLDSYIVNYFPNGEISFQYQTKDGKPAGKMIKYYETGKIRELALTDESKGIIFQTKLDADGNVTYRHGTPLYINYSSKSIKKTDTLGIGYFIPILTGQNARLHIRVINDNGKMVYEKIVSGFETELPHNDYFIIIPGSSSAKMNHIAEVELTDKSGQLLSKGKMEDTISILD